MELLACVSIVARRSTGLAQHVGSTRSRGCAQKAENLQELFHEKLISQVVTILLTIILSSVASPKYHMEGDRPYIVQPRSYCPVWFVSLKLRCFPRRCSCTYCLNMRPATRCSPLKKWRRSVCCSRRWASTPIDSLFFFFCPVFGDVGFTCGLSFRWRRAS